MEVFFAGMDIGEDVPGKDILEFLNCSELTSNWPRRGQDPKICPRMTLMAFSSLADALVEAIPKQFRVLGRI